MLFEILHRSGNRADRLLMYPSNFQLQEGTDQSTESRLLRRARDQYNVKLKPIEVQRSDGGDGKSCWVFQLRNIKLNENIRHMGRELHEIVGFQSNSV